MHDVTFRTLTAPEVRAQFAAFVAVYSDAFAAPPYSKTTSEIAAFAASLPDATMRPGFKVRCAFQTGSLVGFAWGYQAQPGQTLYDVAARQKPALRDSWLSDSFQLAEMAVTNALQGQGIGAQLHDGLLQSATQAKAILATFSAETAAQRLYRNRGWQRLIDSLDVPDLPRPYCMLGKTL